MTLGGILLAGLSALSAQPEAAAGVVAFIAAGLGVWLHWTSPPLDEATLEAIILAASAGM